MRCNFIIIDGYCQCENCGFRTDIDNECQRIHRQCNGTQPSNKTKQTDCVGCGPSIMKKAENLAKASISHALAGFPQATPDKAEERLSICRGCEYYQADRIACNHCGCDLTIKVRWDEQKCPIDKW